MRAFLLLAALLLGAFFAVDQLALDGQYSRTAWQEAHRQGQQFNQQIKSWFRRLG